MITRKQAALFWRCLAAAAECQAVPDREAYRKRVLREELGVEHLRDVDRTEDFDRLMLRLAQDAEDWRGLAYYSVAGERRLADLVADCATQVLELSVAALGLSASAHLDPLGYVSGVLRQSAMSPIRVVGEDYWLDLAPADLARLLQILDTHRRRLIKRLWVGIVEGRLRYVRGRRWYLATGGILDYSDLPLPAPAFRVNVLSA